VLVDVGVQGVPERWFKNWLTTKDMNLQGALAVEWT
jgi:hypothetical protein